MHVVLTPGHVPSSTTAATVSVAEFSDLMVIPVKECFAAYGIHCVTIQPEIVDDVNDEGDGRDGDEETVVFTPASEFRLS